MSDEGPEQGGGTDVADPGREFAQMMNQAAGQAAPERDYGTTIDRETGQERPKKAAGRPRKSPSLDELKAAAAETGTATGTETGDRPPDSSSRRRGRHHKPELAAPAPSYTPGVITKGVNKLYRKAGKIVKVMDPAIGTAIIEATKNTDEEGGDDTVGAAWEEVCRTNPRIRRVILGFIKGGAWGQLLAVHAPILLAIVMKDAIARHIPFMELLKALLDEGDGQAATGDGEDAGQGLLSGLTSEDLGQMSGMFQSMMAGMARRAAAEAPQQAAA